ncbi:hypothetical protein AB6N24_09850 [Cellulomonas sp. 179-A 4D5 NHS]|uniref:hypothetical protein n=1 Tax=Cellulomonas sp. 179-A 4D5 NHS TaxID=3142378 RepID=UPI00399FBBF4
MTDATPPDWLAPRVASVPSRQRVDLGVAGSLRAARARERAARLARYGPLLRDWLTLAALVAAVAAPLLLATMIYGLLIREPGDLRFLAFGILALLIGAPAAWRLGTRWGSGPAEARLAAAIRVEKNLHWHLEHLRSEGWTVLADRLVPGTEARMPFVLIGPGGVVIVTPTPAWGPWQVHNDEAYLQGRPTSEWVRTRWWEATQVQEALEVAAAHLDWVGPTRMLIAVPPHPKASKRAPTDVMQPHPRSIATIPVVSFHHLRDTLLDFPAPLPRELAANLAYIVEDICPPAGVRDHRD